MKKLLLSIILLLACAGVKAQTLAADIAAFRALLASSAHYGCTTPYCRTKTIEAWEADSLCGILERINGAVAAAGDLSAVLTVGNTAALPIHLDNGTTTTDIYPDHVETKKDAGGLLQTYLGILSGIPVMMLENSSGVGYSKLLSVASTNSIINSLPNEGGAGLPGTLVTHTTKDIITVTSPLDTTYVMGGTVKVSGLGYSFTLDNGQLLGDNGLGNTSSLNSGRLLYTNGTANLMAYGVGGMIYEDLASTDATLVEFISPTGNRVQSFPDEGTVGLPGTFVTHTTKDPLTFNNGTLQTTVISNNNVLVSDAGANKQGSLQPGAVVIKNVNDQVTINGNAILYNGISGFTSSLFFNPVTANRQYQLSDDDNGNFDIDHIGTNTQSLSGVTTMVIPHGRSYTPSMVIPVQRSAIGAATNWYVSAITSTNFTITFNAAVTASVTFDFKAIK